MSVKGFTYEIKQEEGVFGFSASTRANTDAWFKKYSTPSAFEIEEKKYGSSWSWMGSPGAINFPNSNTLNSQTGAKLSVHKTPTTESNRISGAPSQNRLGMTFDGNYLWNISRDVKVLYKIDTETGNLLDSVDVSSVAPAANSIQGVTWDGQYFWLNNNSGNANAVYQVTKSGNTVDSNVVSGTSASINKGLAWTGNYLLGNIGGAGHIYKMKTDGTVVDDFDSSGDQGISWDGQYVLSTDFSASEAQIEDTSGNVIQTFNVNEATGIAWDGQYLYVQGFSTNGPIYKFADSTSISYRVSNVT